MENPLTLNTRRAMGVLGAMIREWATQPETLESVATRDGNRGWLIDVDAFHALMKEAKLMHGAAGDPNVDYAVRVGVKEIEILERGANRASLLLPEQSMMDEVNGFADGSSLRIPAFYADTDASGTPLGKILTPPAVDDDRPGFHEVELGPDPLKTFLDPYLAGYLCVQCK